MKFSKHHARKKGHIRYTKAGRRRALGRIKRHFAAKRAAKPKSRRFGRNLRRRTRAMRTKGSHNSSGAPHTHLSTSLMGKMLLAQNPPVYVLDNYTNKITAPVNRKAWMNSVFTPGDPFVVKNQLNVVATATVGVSINTPSSFSTNTVGIDLSDFYIHEWQSVLEIVNRSTVACVMDIYKVKSKEWQYNDTLPVLNQGFWYSAGAFGASGLDATGPFTPVVPATLLTTPDASIRDSLTFMKKYTILKSEHKLVPAGGRLVRSIRKKNFLIDGKTYNDYALDATKGSSVLPMVCRGQEFYVISFRSQILTDASGNSGYPPIDISADNRVKFKYHRINSDVPNLQNTTSYNGNWPAPAGATGPPALKSTGWNVTNGQLIYPESL